MLENRIWNVGILGCGLIAHYHAKSVLELPNARLAGAYDSSETSRKAFCDSYGATEFESMAALIGSPSVDVVCICLPSGLHYETTMTCIQAGKHVIVEKPMTFTTRQADDIIEAAERMGVQVTVISQMRYTDAIARLKEVVDAGWFGKLATADIYMKYYREPDYYSTSNWKGTLAMDGGGALMNQGIHGVDLLQYVMGPVVSVQALTATRCHDIEAEDTVSAILEFESGALGVIQATTSVYPGFSRRLEICGSEGTVILQEDSIIYSAFRQEDRTLPCGKSTHNTGSRPDGMDHSLHKKQIGDFFRALSMGSKPFMDARDGKKAVQIIEAVYAAARTGNKIILK